ncbi:MAG: helix-turn-helix domain-containing protein [Acidobacteriota bacterium]|nr:helix-turn-helix domain-containing protein [Acidobacteriota bacterium]MDQ5837994.1 helix-turn-helix domain-containing protein [Acidobacteriota bacterium]
MGTARQRAERLAEKLLRVRLELGLSQTEMLRRLSAEEMVAYTRISEYERGIREPPLPILLRYARVAGVPTEVLIDDELDLPAKLPGPTNHEEIKRKFTSRAKKK